MGCLSWPTAMAARSCLALSDVANVASGPENSIKLGALDNTNPAIILSIRRQPGANVIEVVDTIKQLLPTIVANLPAAVDVKVLSDRTTTIRASVRMSSSSWRWRSSLLSLLSFFSCARSATIIPSLSVPFSLVGSLGVMYLFVLVSIIFLSWR